MPTSTREDLRAEAVDGTVRSDAMPLGAAVVDAGDDAEIATVDNLSSFPLSIGPYGVRFLVLQRPAPVEG